MDLHKALTLNLATDYPNEAAAALDHLPAEEAASVLKVLPPQISAKVLGRMAQVAAARTAQLLESDEAAPIFCELTVDAAVSILRRVTPETRSAIIGSLPKEYADAVGAVIEFPTGTAGALMDPKLLAYPTDLSVEEAITALRRDAAHAHYNVYVVDRDRVLVGVLNLQELLLADSKDTLESIMKPPQHRLDANADRNAVVRHPGWRQVYSLPVVDSNGRFLGAVRYRALRRLEAELEGDGGTAESTTIRALGDLFGAGFGGLVDAIASTLSASDSERPTGGPSTPSRK